MENKKWGSKRADKKTPAEKGREDVGSFSKKDKVDIALKLLEVVLIILFGWIIQEKIQESARSENIGLMMIEILQERNENNSDLREKVYLYVKDIPEFKNKFGDEALVELIFNETMKHEHSRNILNEYVRRSGENRLKIKERLDKTGKNIRLEDLLRYDSYHILRKDIINEFSINFDIGRGQDG